MGRERGKKRWAEGEKGSLTPHSLAPHLICPRYQFPVSLWRFFVSFAHCFSVNLVISRPFFWQPSVFLLDAVSISRAFHFLIFAVPSFRVKCTTVTRFSHGWLQLRHEHSSRLLAQQEICAHWDPGLPGEVLHHVETEKRKLRRWFSRRNP